MGNGWKRGEAREGRVVCEESMSNGMQREGNEQLLCRGKVQAVTQGKVGVGCSAVEKSVVASPFSPSCATTKLDNQSPISFIL
jgi:hypothetical protein